MQAEPTDAERIAALEARVSELEAIVAKWAHAVGYMDARLSKHLPPAPRTPPAPLPLPAAPKFWDFPAG